jgi:hypothetical protein
MVTLNVYTHLFDSSNQAVAHRLESAFFWNRAQIGHKKQEGANSY